MITLEVNVVHLVFRDEAKFLYFASGGKDIIHTTGMIVDPIITTIVTNQFSPFQVQTRVSRILLRFKVVHVNAFSSKNYPLVMQTETSCRNGFSDRWNCKPKHCIFLFLETIYISLSRQEINVISM